MPQDLSIPISDRDLAFITRAADYLENPGFLMRTANILGKPVEALGRALPSRVQGMASAAVDMALRRALQTALLTLPAAREVEQLEAPADEQVHGRLRHSLAVGVTGAVAGLVGASALAVELPITTAIMLRDIASVAQSLGEDLKDPEVRLQCVGVFNLAGAGGRATERDRELSAMDSSYYAARFTMSGLTREAARYTATVTAEQLARDIATGGSPTLVRFISTVASRFGVVVNQKLVAQAVPAIGAVGGALVNAAFNDHFDRVARYHFGLRALERVHGRDNVQAAYQSALQRLRGKQETA